MPRPDIEFQSNNRYRRDHRCGRARIRGGHRRASDVEEGPCGGQQRCVPARTRRRGCGSARCHARTPRCTDPAARESAPAAKAPPDPPGKATPPGPGAGTATNPPGGPDRPTKGVNPGPDGRPSVPGKGPGEGNTKGLPPGERPRGPMPGNGNTQAGTPPQPPKPTLDLDQGKMQIVEPVGDRNRPRPHQRRVSRISSTRTASTRTHCRPMARPSKRRVTGRCWSRMTTTR